MTQLFTLRIDSIAAGGDGVGRHQGIVVFVPRTAPGDVARVAAVQEGRLMRGRLLELLEPSPDRVVPPCGHYDHDRCGGCQLQHLSYQSQLQAKARVITDSLRRIGRLEVERPEVAPSDAPWRYRRKLTLAMRRREGRWIAGLRRHDAPDEVFELQDCPITDRPVVDHWRSIMQRQELFPAGPSELRGSVRLLTSGFSFTLEGGARWDAGESLFSQLPDLAELWWRPEGRSVRKLCAGGAAEAGASFVQVNAAVAQRLREWVLTVASTRAVETAVDAYAGTGDIAVALAEAGARVTAIEMDRVASSLSATRLPPGSRAIAARVEDALPAALPADLVVVNPPRAGLDARVPAALNSARPLPRSVIYVSCDPATLARDLRRLERFRVESLRGFDMFPQTAHVETVCALVPAA